MNNKKTTSEPLDYLAFEYIAGEMSPDDAAQFEDQLCEDQMARQAVANAVELSIAIARVSAEPVSVAARSAVETDIQHRWIRPTVWLTATTAACLAAVVFWQGFNSSSNDSTETPTEVETGLAQIWADTLSDELSPASFEDRTDEGEEPDASEFSSSPGETNEEPLAPDWLMAALADESEVNVEMNEVDPAPEGS